MNSIIENLETETFTKTGKPIKDIRLMVFYPKDKKIQPFYISNRSKPKEGMKLSTYKHIRSHILKSIGKIQNDWAKRYAVSVLLQLLGLHDFEGMIRFYYFQKLTINEIPTQFSDCQWELHYKDGFLHNVDGPSELNFYDCRWYRMNMDIGKITNETYYLNDKIYASISDYNVNRKDEILKEFYEAAKIETIKNREEKLDDILKEVLNF